MPSSRASRRAATKASRSVTWMILSTTAGSKVPGQKSSPTPSILYGAIGPEKIEPSGSAPTTWIAAFCSLR